MSLPASFRNTRACGEAAGASYVLAGEFGAPIRAVASRVVYENKWMTVREDDVIRADGSAGIFGVVEKPDFALVIPYDGEGFYVVEQFRYPVAGRYVEFPQGSWEDDPDVDPLDLARAELAEETGLRAGEMTYLGHPFEAYGYCNQGSTSSSRLNSLRASKRSPVRRPICASRTSLLAPSASRYSREK
jgi:NUDIX domain-containing protein